jgi:outer membrane protein assembly factor BamA
MQAGVDFGLTGIWPLSSTGAFVKGNFDYRWYTPAPWSNRASFALRGHVGAIFPFGSLPLIPAAQRFTAGGANSIRGWGPREMLATTVQSDSTLTAGISPELRNTADSVIAIIFKESKRLLGGLAILELSAELRVRMFNLGGTGILARQLNQLGLNVFVDAGNAFFRDYQDDRGLKIFQNIGLSVGLSIGYDTPVGPFQVGYGYPLYDPVNHSGDERWAWGRKLKLTDGAWQVSIGFAF